MTTPEKETQLYKKAYNLKLKTLEKAADEIGVRELKDLHHRFYENMDTLSTMVCLPVILCSEEFMGFNTLLLDLEARLASGASNKWEDISEEDKKKYLNERERLWETKYKPKREQVVNEAIRNAEEKFGYLQKRPEIYTSYRSLLYSGVVFIWCSFELFMKDLWEMTLNKAGENVKKMALGNIGKIENNAGYVGIKGKYVNLDYLGQYDFNVSKRLGSILVNKFDFSSPYGIKEAFLCLFPKSMVMKKSLENEGLAQLEARRSLIVHRAGVIDSAFCKKTGTSQKEIGNYLNLSDEEVFGFGNVTIEVTSKVVIAISTILSSRKKLV